MPPSVYTNRAIKATDDLIAFYKDKISELEKFKEDLEIGKIQGGEYDDFGKYYVITRPRDDKRIVFWSKNPDKPYRGSDVFSIRYDDKHEAEPVGICDVAVLDFAVIIDRIRSEHDDPDILYGGSDEDGNLRYKDDDSKETETGSDSECD